MCQLLINAPVHFTTFLGVRNLEDRNWRFEPGHSQSWWRLISRLIC